MQIFLKNLDGKQITLELKPHDTIGNVKTKLHQDDRVQAKLPEGTTADELRIVFKGKQLDNDTTTLSGYEVGPLDTLHLLLRVRGGAKRGCKKTISKGERIAAMTARTQYLRTHVQQPNYTNIVDRVSDAGYTQWAIGQMVANNSMQQLSELDTTAQEITRSDRVAEGVVQKLVPELAQMQQQKEQIEAAMKAIEEGFTLGFAQAYTTDKGWEVDGFYSMIEEAKNNVTNALNQQAVQNQINHAVAQAQAQAAQAQN